MAGNASGKRELGKELLQSGLVLADVGIDLGVGALEVGVGDQGRAAVAGSGDVEHVQVVLRNDPVQVHIDEVLTRRRSPMTAQAIGCKTARSRSLGNGYERF